jgi:hypothetical protein
MLSEHIFPYSKHENMPRKGVTELEASQIASLWSKFVHTSSVTKVTQANTLDSFTNLTPKIYLRQFTAFLSIFQTTPETWKRSILY